MSKTNILQAIQDYYYFKKDSQFAKFLGVTPQVLSNWKARGTFDINIVYTKCVDFSLEWLVTGEGEMLKQNDTYLYKQEESQVYIASEPSISYNNRSLEQENNELLRFKIEVLLEKLEVKENEIEQLKKELSLATIGQSSPADAK